MRSGWDAPYTSIGWGGECDPIDTYDRSQDVGHDDNEETDPNQDEYEPKEEVNIDAEDDDDDEGSLFSLLLFFDFLFYNMQKTNAICSCYVTDDQDPEVEMARLHGQIGQKDAKIRELQGHLHFEGGGDYLGVYQDLQVANKEIKDLYEQLR